MSLQGIPWESHSMAAPSPWMLRWQETPDDPILYEPAWDGEGEDAASAELPPPSLPQSTAGDVSPDKTEDSPHV